MVGETGDYVKLVAIVKKKVSSANRHSSWSYSVRYIVN